MVGNDGWFLLFHKVIQNGTIIIERPIPSINIVIGITPSRYPNVDTTVTDIDAIAKIIVPRLMIIVSKRVGFISILLSLPKQLKHNFGAIFFQFEYFSVAIELSIISLLHILQFIFNSP